MGGSPDGEVVPQTTVALRFYPVGVKGQVGVRVHLESTVWHDQPDEAQSLLQTELFTTYGALQLFSAELKSMANDAMDQARLAEDRLD